MLLKWTQELESKIAILLIMEKGLVFCMKIKLQSPLSQGLI